MREAVAGGGRRPAPDAVFNQTPPLGHVDLFATDAALIEALSREGAGGGASDGRKCGR